MKSLKASNFYTSMLPIFIYSTIVGVFPMFPLKKGGKYTLYASRKLHFITAILLCVFSLCFINTIIRRSNNVVGQKFYKKQNKVSNFGISFEFTFGVVILYTIYSMSLVHKKHATNVILNLNLVDDKLRKLNYKMKYEKMVWYQLVLIFSGLFMVVLIASMQISNMRVEKFPPIALDMWICFLYPLVVLYALNSQYGIVAILIFQRLQIVNKILDVLSHKIHEKSIKFETKRGYYMGENNQKILTTLNVLMKIYAVLCESANRTNLNFNVQMIPALAHQFFISLYSIFYYYWMHSTKPFSALCWLAWGIFKTYEILHVTIACHLASQEVGIVGRKVHKVLIRTNNNEVEEKLLAFSQQVSHGKFKFSLCGLFNIDGSLLFNMIGSSTTFIVIMIQFQETITPTACNKYTSQ